MRLAPYLTTLLLMPVGNAVAADDIDVTSREMIFPGPYRAEIVSVTDGDTVDMRVAIWPGLVALYSIRLRGIDAPETWRPTCDAERVAGEAAARRVEDLTRGDPELRISDVSFDAYANRVVADLDVSRGNGWQSVARDLVAHGHARDWTPEMDDVPWDEIYCAEN